MRPTQLGMGRRIAYWLVRFLILAAITAAATLFFAWRLQWWGAKGLSDALFLVGIAELIISAAAIWGSPTDAAGNLSERFMAGIRDRPGSNERQQQIVADMFQKTSFFFQGFIISLLTMLLAVAVSLIWG